MDAHGALVELSGVLNVTGQDQSDAVRGARHGCRTRHVLSRYRDDGGRAGPPRLNKFKRPIIQNVLQSRGILADSAIRFARHIADKLAPNHERIAENLVRSLMLVTALTSSDRL
jgi:hypothetical protein